MLFLRHRCQVTEAAHGTTPRENRAEASGIAFFREIRRTKGGGTHGQGGKHPSCGLKTSPLPCDRKMGTHNNKSIVFSIWYTPSLAREAAPRSLCRSYFFLFNAKNLRIDENSIKKIQKNLKILFFSVNKGFFLNFFN